MWISKSLLDLFSIGRETVDTLRTENTTLRASNQLLERELVSAKIMSDWLRLKVNQLEVERVHLLAKAYPNLSLPAPELARTTQVSKGFDLQALFEDQGDPPDTLPVPKGFGANGLSN
jgi:hypothetical protein